MMGRGLLVVNRRFDQGWGEVQSRRFSFAIKKDFLGKFETDVKDSLEF